MISATSVIDELTNGLFGKLPSHGDFVRINVSGAAFEFAKYIENAVDVCRRASCEQEILKSYFLYRAPNSATALIGILQSSNDAVGRIFPLSVFTAIESESAAGNFDILPLAFSPFFESALLLADEAEQLSIVDLKEQVLALPFPSVEEFKAAQDQGDAILQDTSIALFKDSPIRGSVKDWEVLALATIAAACEQSSDVSDESKIGITLDIPLIRNNDEVLWLGVIRRLLGEQMHCPNIIWTLPRISPSIGSVKVEVPPIPGKLLVSLGAPPPSALAFLCGLLGDSPRLWQVSSNDAAAIERAKETLSAEQLAVIADPVSTIESVVSAFGG